MDLTDLDAFVRVAQLGSITKAAAELGVPKSTVSRRVSRLEDALGLPLVVRAPRSVSLTEHGRRLHERSAPALREIAEAERELADSMEEPSGLLRVTAPQDFGESWYFAELLLAFRERCPKVRLEVELTNRVVDLIEEGFDLAFRPHRALPDTDALSARRLLPEVRAAVYASPAYLEAHGAPEHPSDLRAHGCVRHRLIGKEGGWRLRGPKDPEVVAYEVDEVLAANDFGLLLRYVRAGGGLGLIPSLQAGRFVSTGELVPVLVGWTAEQSSLWLLWPTQRHMAPRIRAFLDLVFEESDAGRLWGE